jgi:hypothetical protein
MGMKTKEELLDLQFVEMRHLVVELAAFLDRIDRCPGNGDFRVQALQKAIMVLSEPGTTRAKAVLDSLSDTSTEPTDTKAGPPACGAPRPSPSSSSIH